MEMPNFEADLGANPSKALDFLQALEKEKPLTEEQLFYYFHKMLDFMNNSQKTDLKKYANMTLKLVNHYVSLQENLDISKFLIEILTEYLNLHTQKIRIDLNEKISLVTYLLMKYFQSQIQEVNQKTNKEIDQANTQMQNKISHLFTQLLLQDKKFNPIILMLSEDITNALGSYEMVISSYFFKGLFNSLYESLKQIQKAFYFDVLKLVFASLTHKEKTIHNYFFDKQNNQCNTCKKHYHDSLIQQKQCYICENISTKTKKKSNEKVLSYFENISFQDFQTFFSPNIMTQLHIFQQIGVHLREHQLKEESQTSFSLFLRSVNSISFIKQELQTLLHAYSINAQIQQNEQMNKIDYQIVYMAFILIDIGISKYQIIQEIIQFLEKNLHLAQLNKSLEILGSFLKYNQEHFQKLDKIIINKTQDEDPILRTRALNVLFTLFQQTDNDKYIQVYIEHLFDDDVKIQKSIQKTLNQNYQLIEFYLNPELISKLINQQNSQDGTQNLIIRNYIFDENPKAFVKKIQLLQPFQHDLSFLQNLIQHESKKNLLFYTENLLEQTQKDEKLIGILYQFLKQDLSLFHQHFQTYIQLLEQKKFQEIEELQHIFQLELQHLHQKRSIGKIDVLSCELLEQQLAKIIQDSVLFCNELILENWAQTLKILKQENKMLNLLDQSLSFCGQLKKIYIGNPQELNISWLLSCFRVCALLVKLLDKEDINEQDVGKLFRYLEWFLGENKEADFLIYECLISVYQAQPSFILKSQKHLEEALSSPNVGTVLKVLRVFLKVFESLEQEIKNNQENTQNKEELKDLRNKEKICQCITEVIKGKKKYLLTRNDYAIYQIFLTLIDNLIKQGFMGYHENMDVLLYSLLIPNQLIQTNANNSVRKGYTIAQSQISFVLSSSLVEVFHILEEQTQPLYKIEKDDILSNFDILQELQIYPQSFVDKMIDILLDEQKFMVHLFTQVIKQIVLIFLTLRVMTHKEFYLVLNTIYNDVSESIHQRINEDDIDLQIQVLLKLTLFQMLIIISSQDKPLENMKSFIDSGYKNEKDINVDMFLRIEEVKDLEVLFSYLGDPKNFEKDNQKKSLVKKIKFLYKYKQKNSELLLQKPSPQFQKKIDGFKKNNQKVSKIKKNEKKQSVKKAKSSNRQSIQNQQKSSQAVEQISQSEYSHSKLRPNYKTINYEEQSYL